MKTLIEIQNEIITEAKIYIAKRGYDKVSTCNHSNWDKYKHFAMLDLQSKGAQGISISLSVNWGVYD